MEKKQSSIEWLVQELNHNVEFIPLVNHWDKIRDIIQQAKAMHKEEIINAYQAGDGDAYNLDETRDFGEQYYNETFGGDK